ncbi:MAG: adenylate kinase [Flavobacteriales bacterium]|nr:adenylate kinase [Flavobacteriales bacterium]
MLNLVLFGPPGAGKGTQAESLGAKYNLHHISTGDVFRYNIKNETDLGKLAKSFMDQGKLVPDEVTIDMLGAEVSKHAKCHGFIFDGFPRTVSQAKALDALLLKKGTKVSGMFSLEVPEAELKTRLMSRAKVSGRADDADPKVIQNRIDVYNSETAPVKDFYTDQGKYNGIDGVGSIDAIFDRLCTAIDKLNS